MATIKTAIPKETAEGRALTTAAAIASEISYELMRAADTHLFCAQHQVLLLQLYVHGEIAQQDLPSRVGLQKGAVSQGLAKLGPGKRLKQGLGWIDTEDDPMDGRRKMVRITARGREVVRKAASKVAHYLS